MQNKKTSPKTLMGKMKGVDNHKFLQTAELRSSKSEVLQAHVPAGVNPGKHRGASVEM